MADYPSRYVVDTSLLIDLYVGKIIIAFFKLPYMFSAPDVIIAELQTIDSKTLIDLGLQQSELTGGQILEVMRLRALYRRPSVNDLFALVTAQVNDATLLTGDKNLRKAAQQEGVPVHGTLWVLDEMVRLHIISRRKAAGALQLMRDGGSRLPLDECHKRIIQWLDEG